MSDTERFVDQAENPIAPMNTWPDLTINQLIDTKVQLEDKLWAFRNNPAMVKVLKPSIDNITALIAERALS